MFTSQLTPVRFLAVLLLSTVLLAGCSRSTPETKPPEAPQLGIISVDKAVQSHPKYQEWQNNKQQAATIKEQLAATAGKGIAQSQAAINLPGNMAASIQSAVEQEFKVKIAAKQQELQARLLEQAGKKRQELSAQLEAYAGELNQQYQPQLFNLQLKLQTVRMDEQQATALKQEINAVKAEQAAKLSAKEQEMAQQMEAALAPEKAAMEQELAAYAAQLNRELDNKLSAQTAELSAKLTQPAAAPSAADSSLQQQLGMKQQEIKVLEEFILNDIRDKTAKIAVERGLEAVLTGQQVNVRAVDLTDAVIDAIKK